MERIPGARADFRLKYGGREYCAKYWETDSILLKKVLWGIETLNEPVSEGVWNFADIPNRDPAADKEEAKGSGPVPSDFLRAFYVEAYRRMRKYLPEDKVVVFHGFRLREWKDFS